MGHWESSGRLAFLLLDDFMTKEGSCAECPSTAVLYSSLGGGSVVCFPFSSSLHSWWTPSEGINSYNYRATGMLSFPRLSDWNVLVQNYGIVKALLDLSCHRHA